MHRRWRGARTALPGRRWDPPWPSAAPPAAPEVPVRFVRQAGRRWPSAVLRRGQRWDAPAAEPPPAPSPWTVTGVGRRARWAAPKPRGSRWDPPWPITAPPPPEVPAAFVQARRPTPPLQRHGRQWSAPAAVPWVAPWRGSRRPRSWPRLARGHRWTPPPTVGAVNPGIWLPGFHRQHVALPRFTHRLRRGRQWSPPWPFVEPALTSPPRWVESAAAGVGLLDDAAGGTTQLDTAAGGSGLHDDAASGTGVVEDATGGTGLVDNQGGV